MAEDDVIGIDNEQSNSGHAFASGQAQKVGEIAAVESTPQDLGKQARYYQHARREVLDLVPITAARLLDVGCGMGTLGAALKERQHVEVHGVELVPEVAEVAMRRLDRVWIGPVEAALPDLPQNYYDCIVAADVLEHLVDPWTVLATLRGKLAQGGRIVASIPNLQNWAVLSGLIEGRFTYESEGILDRTHLRFFTRKSVEELFWGAGFCISHIGATVSESGPTVSTLQRLRSVNVDIASLERDGRTFQFLVQAFVPPPVSPPVALVVLNWNGKADTLECLESIRGLDYPDLSIVVVDNGSSDGSVAAIKSAHPSITLLETGANLGYAGGNNVGIRWALDAGAEFVLVLNNDTVVDAGLIRTLVDAAAVAPDFGYFSPRICFYDRPGELWYAGARWDAQAQRTTHLHYGQAVAKCPERPHETGYASGCALFLRRQAIQDVGTLDADLFLTFEETDLCYRGRRQGWRSMVVPQAQVLHKVSVSFGGADSPTASYYMTRNRLKWGWRHLALRQFLGLLAVMLRELSPRMPALRRQGVGLPTSAYWAAAEYLRAWRQLWASPAYRARLCGARDFLLGRSGARPRAT